MNISKTIHFIGIGGAGMSGLAEIFHYHGYKVQGSDVKKTKVTDRLEELGITVDKTHSARNIKDADYVVYSSCIKDDNREFSEAKKKNIPLLQRIEALNMLLGDKNIIAISGSHGKTTTTSLISYLLIEGGFDPTVFIGADVYFLDGNARYGKSNIVVTEADESDGSFLLMQPFYSVATNIDKEHMDYYASMDEVVSAYKRFIENTKDKGCAFVCMDDNKLKDIVENASNRVVSYGISQDADIRADNIELLGLDGSVFDLVIQNRVQGRLKLSITGMHNILNSLPAVGIAMDLGMDFASIKNVISGFKGADRRFKVTYLDPDILVIDDYAHHPTEIKATLKVFESSTKRKVVVFQPHRFSRTEYLREEFGRSFNLADYLIITDIYSAYEEPIDGVSAKNICESAERYGHKDVHFVVKDDIIGHLRDIVRPGDAVFILGAGDIGELPERIVKALAPPR